MKTQKLLDRQWSIVGASCGIAANLLFPVILLIPLPDAIEVAMAALFGILFSLTGFGIHHAIKEDHPTIATHIGAIFLCAAGIIFNLMLMVQLTFRGYMAQFTENAHDPKQVELLGWIKKTVDPIHLGFQVSADFFTAIPMILFGFAMLQHRRFGEVWGLSGILIGSTLLFTKCYSFPMTPEEVGIPYFLGPLVALWFLAVCTKCLNQTRTNPKLAA